MQLVRISRLADLFTHGKSVRCWQASSLLVVGVLVFIAGCASSQGKKPLGQTSDTGKEPVQRVAMTAENNPTFLAGRGEPDLDEFFQPAAWIYIDGQKGHYVEEDGNPQIQWVIDGPVSSTPTFRIEIYEPLLAAPKDFNCILDTIESVDGSKVEYAISAAEGTFVVGREYSLLQPGDNFTIRNRSSGDVVIQIPSLAPGTYLLAGGVKSLDTGKEGLAVTYFTVGEGQ